MSLCKFHDCTTTGLCSLSTSFSDECDNLDSEDGPVSQLDNAFQAVNSM